MGRKPTKKASKAHHEAKEEPNPGSNRSEAAISEPLPSQEAVRDCIHHKHRDGGEDPAKVKHISRVLIVCSRGINGKPPAREEEKARGDGGNLVSLFIEIHVLEALKRTGLQKARHP